MNTERKFFPDHHSEMRDGERADLHGWTIHGEVARLCESAYLSQMGKDMLEGMLNKVAAEHSDWICAVVNSAGEAVHYYSPEFMAVLERIEVPITETLYSKFGLIYQYLVEALLIALDAQVYIFQNAGRFDASAQPTPDFVCARGGKNFIIELKLSRNNKVARAAIQKYRAMGKCIFVFLTACEDLTPVYLHRPARKKHQSKRRGKSARRETFVRARQYFLTDVLDRVVKNDPRILRFLRESDAPLSTETKEKVQEVSRALLSLQTCVSKGGRFYKNARAHLSAMKQMRDAFEQLEAIHRDAQQLVEGADFQCSPPLEKGAVRERVMAINVLALLRFLDGQGDDYHCELM